MIGRRINAIALQTLGYGRQFVVVITPTIGLVNRWVHVIVKKLPRTPRTAKVEVVESVYRRAPNEVIDVPRDFGEGDLSRPSRFARLVREG